jgi:hypothetical protein
MPRYAQLLVTGDLLAGMFTAGTLHALPVANHLPDGTSLVGAYTAHPGIIGLVFEHDSFPETAPGSDAAMLPVLPDIQFRSAPSPILPRHSHN